MGKFRWPTTGKPPLTEADRKKKQADHMKALRKARAEGRPVPKYNSKGLNHAEIAKAEKALEETDAYKILETAGYWALADQDDES
jgi:hypothetical protein